MKIYCKGVIFNLILRIIIIIHVLSPKVKKINQKKKKKNNAKEKKVTTQILSTCIR